MPDTRPLSRLATAGEDLQQTLRELGARAHQLRAATRAADHYNTLDGTEDRDTGSWLMSCALSMSAELAEEIDDLARSLREQPVDAALQAKVARLRVRMHQLHAAARAADHFLDQDTNEDRDTGSWLIATALGLAQKLASEIDDGTLPLRRPPAGKVAIEGHDAALSRRMAAATTPVFGAA